MIDSLAAPSWIPNEDSNLCSRCRDPFTLTNRRHHCRNCGQLFDQKCSSNLLPLPHFGITTAVRVCDGCTKKVKSGRRHTIEPAASPRSLRSRSSSSYRHSSTSAKEDQDLQMALRLSLQDSQVESSSSGYRPNYNYAADFGPRRDGKQEVEDPDLAAAIAASLRDMELAPSAPAFVATASSTVEGSEIDERLVRLISCISETNGRHDVQMPNMDLRAPQLDVLLTFSQTTLRSKMQPTSTTVNDLAPLYERAEGARRYLVEGVKDAAGKERESLASFYQ